MATTFKVLKGKGKWVKVLLPDTTFGDPQYRMDLYLDPESVETFKSLKVKNRVYRDDEGDYVHLKRDVQKSIKGQTVSFAPPTVLDKDGTPFSGTAIGNGSDLTVTVEHYNYGKVGGPVLPGYGIRIHTVQVDNLVPYQPNKPKETANELPVS